MTKSLFLSLLYAQTEEEVKRIIECDSMMKEPSNWTPYGGTTGNYSSFENQQSTAEGALMEKITNSIDAILVRQALQKGVDPSDKNAPSTMKEALNVLFTKEELEKQKVLVLVDGKLQEPNIIIADDGEGQEPANFDKTLLSLQRGNKNNIKFVQGKFNMGSTGAAVFCGKYKYQLIASKRHNDLSGTDEIGFTIVRKHVRTKEEQETMKNTWYEYFTVDGNIPFFTEKEFLLTKESSQNISFTQGTIVKLYNYKLNKKSPAFQTLKEEINNLLYYPAFHIHVHELRKEFKQIKERGGIMNISYGNGHLLRGGVSAVLDKALEYKSVKNVIKSPVFGEAEIDLFVFDEHQKNTARTYRGNKPIVFLMNGQVQYHLSTSFLSSTLGFKLIKDHVVVSIDCTNLKKEFMDEGFFMANRETIRDTEETRIFLQEITQFLKEHKELIRLNKLRASKKISSNGTKNLFERILGKNQKDKFLRNLFQENSMGSNTKYNSHLSQDGEKEEKELSEFPTYVKLRNVKKDEQGDYRKTLPLGKKAKITLELDAVNDYFTRDDSTGQLKVSVTQEGNTTGSSETETPSGQPKDVTNQFTLSNSDLHNGEMSLAVSPNPSTVQVGDEFKVTIDVKDNQQTFQHIFFLKVEQPAKKDPQEKRNKKKEKLTLPPVFQVFKDASIIEKLERTDEEKADFETWEDRGWDIKTGKEKIVEIVPGTDGQPISAIYINMSSAVLDQIITEEGTTGIKIEQAHEQFLTNLYMQSFVISAAINNLQKQKETAEMYGISIEELDIEAFVEDCVKQSAYALVKMQMNNLKAALV